MQKKKTKRISKVLCSDTMLENLTKGREKKKPLHSCKTEEKRSRKLTKEKEECKNQKKTNFELKEVKK